MKLISLAFILSSFLCCTKKESHSMNKDSVLQNVIYSNKEIADSLSTKIFDNDFILRIDKDLKWKRIDSIYQATNSDLKFIQNEHYPEKQDTIVTFTKYGDSIIFHKAIGNSFPQKIVLTSKKVTLDGDIRIGVGKKIFCDRFHIKSISDKLIVGDIGGFYHVTFLFEKERLKKVVFETIGTD